MACFTHYKSSLRTSPVNTALLKSALITDRAGKSSTPPPPQSSMRVCFLKSELTTVRYPNAMEQARREALSLHVIATGQCRRFC